MKLSSVGNDSVISAQDITNARNFLSNFCQIDSTRSLCINKRLEVVGQRGLMKQLFLCCSNGRYYSQLNPEKSKERFVRLLDTSVQHGNVGRDSEFTRTAQEACTLFNTLLDQTNNIVPKQASAPIDFNAHFNEHFRQLSLERAKTSLAAVPCDTTRNCPACIPTITVSPPEDGESPPDSFEGSTPFVLPPFPKPKGTPPANEAFSLPDTGEDFFGDASSSLSPLGRAPSVDPAATAKASLPRPADIFTPPPKKRSRKDWRSELPPSPMRLRDTPERQRRQTPEA